MRLHAPDAVDATVRLWDFPRVGGPLYGKRQVAIEPEFANTKLTAGATASDAAATPPAGPKGG
jgi:hypothetical protein